MPTAVRLVSCMTRVKPLMFVRSIMHYPQRERKGDYLVKTREVKTFGAKGHDLD